MKLFVKECPDYTGPYCVGSQDFEVLASELMDSGRPDPPKAKISTVAFRLFYPCHTSAPCSRAQHKKKPVYWLPKPPAKYLKGYAKFCGANPMLASLLSHFPFGKTKFDMKLPADADAPALQPPFEGDDKTDGRWPVLVFSHGLGGTRNAYSYICGNLASHGMVVAAVEHRDGSAPFTSIHATNGSPGSAVKYETFGKGIEKEAHGERDLMLSIRCWELALVYRALEMLDNDQTFNNILEPNPQVELRKMLEIHAPGKVAWAGHSFGAATIVQFLKSVYHGNSSLLKNISVELKEQITPASPSIFLDLWTLPITSPTLASLRAKPLPCNEAAWMFQELPIPPMKPSAPLIVLSSNFYHWESNYDETLAILCPSDRYEWPISPRVFYRAKSAHLSQSDFGILLPRLTKKLLKAEEPLKTLILNTRAILASLRRDGVKVAEATEADLFGNEHSDRKDEILSPSPERIVGWVPVPDKAVYDKLFSG